MDPVFVEEQNHLTTTYKKLQAIEAEQLDKVENLLADASSDKSDMAEELTIDLADFDSTLETLASIESLNRIVDSYNIATATAEDRLVKCQLLLKQPYFAKVVLQVKPETPPREIYLGVTGMSDETGRLFIVDWRAPVAETYYNQSFGHTSYRVDGRTIEVDLQMRRQFDIDHDKLHAYFDTTVAIEDPLLLKALSRQHTSQMQAITTTIQKEQNTVIRHDDVPVMLVRGIAGSGKTSVLLQRIAYLLYLRRGEITPDQLQLITPNSVFNNYISHVLPDMGEHNPTTSTWTELAHHLGIPANDRGRGRETVEMLERIDEACKNAQLTPDDCRAVRLGEEILIPVNEVMKLAKRFGNVKDSRRQCECVAEELHDKLDQKTLRDSTSTAIHVLIDELGFEEQCRRFGHPIDTDDEEQVREAGLQYVTELYEPIHKAIDEGCWISTRRLAKRLIGGRGLKPLERAYLKLTFAGTGDSSMEYAMIDEVQDYTVAQLMVIARLFPKAHFLLLGDPNQAIYEGTATFDEIRSVFEKTHGSVSECALMTSYRSTPEITALFSPIAEERDRMNITSVQREGNIPGIFQCDDRKGRNDVLRETLAKASEQPAGLTAVIMHDTSSLKSLANELGNAAPSILDGSTTLPDKGVIMLDLPLAKGLEFDRVIIPDASEANYPDDALSRHRLYTAISRATQQVTIISDGPLTKLLSQAAIEEEM